MAPWSGTLCRTTSAHSRTMSPLDRVWKPGFSPDTSVFSALETFVIIALYKSTFTIPYHTIAYRHPMPASVNRYLQPTLCWAANPLLQSNDGKTDRCTDTQPLHWPCSTYYAGSATHTHIRLTALCSGLPGSAGTRMVKPTWILLKQEIVSGSGISWAICKSAPRSRQITMPAPHHLVFLQAGCPSCRPTNRVKALKAVDQNIDRNIVNRRKIKTILILLCFISFSSV